MSADSTSWQETWMDALLNAQTETDVFRIMCTAARGLGFDHCAYGMRTAMPLSNPKTHLLNNYSNAWQQRYAEQNYLMVDPTVAHAMSSIAPLVWNDQIFINCGAFWEDARAHGLQVGWSQASYDSKGNAGLLTLARSHDALTPAELRDHGYKMAWLAQASHARLSRLILASQPAETQAALTAREIEILRWTADGKTSGDVSQILRISERTVNFHVQNSMDKLCVSNKTAAVIKAAMLRLL